MGGTVGEANPWISGGSGLENEYVVDGVNITNQGDRRARAGTGFVFCSLRQRDAVRLHESSADQERRLRGRIRTGHRRRRERRHQAGTTVCAARCSASLPDRAGLGFTHLTTPNGTVNTTGTEAARRRGLRPGGPTRRTSCFLRRRGPAVGEADVHRAGSLPARESPAKLIASGR